MFFPAYQLDSFTSESEALQSMELTSEDLKLSQAATAVSGEVPESSKVKIVKSDETIIFVYHSDKSVSVWFSDDYWECEALENAEELIESVEGGIPAEYWAVFETRTDNFGSNLIH